jgi:hypothetical protein
MVKSDSELHDIRGKIINKIMINISVYYKLVENGSYKYKL